MKKPTIRELLNRSIWMSVVAGGALLLLTCVEMFDFLSKEICVQVRVLRGNDLIQEPAEIQINGERGEAWVNGKRVW